MNKKQEELLRDRKCPEWVANRLTYQTEFYRAESQGKKNVGQNYDQSTRLNILGEP